MRRMKSRLVTVLTVIAMVALLVPAMPASAAITDTGTGGPPVKIATADAQATTRGINVRVANLPADVTGLDIYRSTTGGVEGVKLNVEPVVGDSYLDETVSAGTTYFYTVKVASRDAAADPGRFDAPDTLLQVSATSLKARTARVEAASAPKVNAGPRGEHDKVSASAAPAAQAVSEAQVAAMATTIGSAGQVTTLTASKTWTTAMSPIFVRGDLVVPVGKTLTIQPGVKVYFDTIDSGTADVGTKDNPTSKVDLIVHGKLVAQGTASSRVLLTSIMSLPSSSSVDPWLPQAGDWGVIFNDSRAASVVNYCQIEYGRGCWSRATNRPYYTNSIFQENSVRYEKPWGAIYFEQPVADAVTPRIIIKSNIISGGYEGIVVYATDESGGNYGPNRSGDLILDPYIAYNTVKADYALDLEAWDNNDAIGNGNSYVRGTVVGNRLWSNNDEPVYLYATANDGKIAKISTAFSGNTISSSDDYGVYAYAAGNEYGKAYIAPTFSGDKISSYSQVLYADAYSNEDTTAVGAASITPKFTSCTLAAADDDGMYLYAYSYNEGPAVASPVFVNGSLETASCEGIEADAYSYYGNASACPSLTNVYGGGHDSCEFLYLNAYSYDDGTAKANPRIVGGKIINMDDAAVYCYAESYEATAEAKPYVANAFIQGYDAGFECYAYANYNGDGKGTADVSGTFTNSTIRVAYVDYDSEGYDGYYGYADSGYRGAAKASPTFDKSNVRALSTHGIDVYAYSDDGSAYASPVVKNGSSIEGYYSGINAYAGRDADTSGLTGNAVSSPSITNSSVKSYYDAAVYAEAYGYDKGDAVVAPKIVSSRIENHYEDGAMGLYATKSSGATGTASVAPYVADSYLFGSDWYVIEPEADGPGVVEGDGVSKAIVAGTYLRTTFENDYYDCISGWTENYGGSGYFTPAITDCTMIATDDNAVDYDVRAWGTGSHESVNAPVFTRCNLTRTADAIALEAWNTDTVATSTARCAPVVKDSSIYATWDYPVYSYARSNGVGDAINGTYIYNTTMKCYDGVYNRVHVEGTGNAYNNAKVLGKSSKARATIEAFDDDAVSNFTNSLGGSSTDRSQTKYLNLQPQYSGVDVSLSSASGTVTAASVVSGNVVGLKWTAADDGISVSADGAKGVYTPSITSNSVGAVDGVGIYAYGGGSDLKFAPVISGNSVGSAGMGASDDGIYVQSNYSNLLPGSMTTVSKNVINYPYGNGIELYDVTNGLVQGNKVSFPAFNNSSNGWYDTAGIYWSYAGAEASATAAQVRGNVVTDARHAIVYEGGWATTQYNVFKDSLNRTNRPWNLGTDKSGLPTAKLNATANWWGTTSASAIQPTVNAWNSISATDAVDFSAPLTGLKPVVKSIVKSKSGSTYTFKVTFDRAMDTSVKTLTFGKSSPFKTYKTKVGTWNSAGTMLTVKYTGTIAAGKYYFAGAKDWPGTLMNSTSKSFMP